MFGGLPAKKTMCAPYICMVLANPTHTQNVYDRTHTVTCVLLCRVCTEKTRKYVWFWPTLHTSLAYKKDWTFMLQRTQ